MHWQAAPCTAIRPFRYVKVFNGAFATVSPPRVLGGAMQFINGDDDDDVYRPHICTRPHLARIMTASTAAKEPCFSVEESVTMAALSFEAYLQPRQGTGYLDVALNGTTTQYLSQEFVRSTFSALVEVTVKSAHNLTASDVCPHLDMPPLTASAVNDTGTYVFWILATLIVSFSQGSFVLVGTVPKATLRSGQFCDTHGGIKCR
jgi:hypothetical protein